MSEATPALDPKYADLLIECPNPEHRDGQAMSLGEFLQTERGQKYGAVALTNIANAESLVDQGIDESAALKISFGGALQTDEQGAILRADIEPQPEANFETTFDNTVEAPKPSPKGVSWLPAQ